jgi:SAM-dependent methyltransferase
MKNERSTHKPGAPVQRTDVYRLYTDGRHYDRMFAGAPGEGIHFWLVLVNRYGGPVLELGCGTGLKTIPLAHAGFQVTGIDLAADMLEHARRKAAEQGVSVEWVQGDVRAFDLGRKFSLVIFPNNVLCHLLDRPSFEACMGCVKKHLAPYGRFALDVFVPSQELLLDKPGERFPFAEYDDPDGRGRVLVTHSYVYEPHTQIKRTTTHHRVGGEEEVAGRLDMRMYYPEELDALLHYNGFAIEHKYGGFDQRPFGAQSTQQVIVCRLA